MRECIPEVVKVQRACIKETGESKLFPAGITTNDPAEMIARGKYVFSQLGGPPYAKTQHFAYLEEQLQQR